MNASKIKLAAQEKSKNVLHLLRVPKQNGSSDEETSAML